MILKNKRINKILIGILVLSLFIAGVFAFLEATDNKRNVFTVGNIDIVLHEDGWTDDDGDGEYNREDKANEVIMPGQKVPKAPYVENTGLSNAYVFVTVGIPTVQKNPADENQVDITFSKTDIPIKAYAIQEGYNENLELKELYYEYFEQEIINDFKNEVTDEEELLNRVELFSVSNPFGENWEQSPQPFKSEDGYNYYIYAYTKLLKASESTSEIFEYVELNIELTSSTDIIFQPNSESNLYYTKTDIGENKAQELFNTSEPMTYAGPIESDFTPLNGDIFLSTQANKMFEFDSESQRWIYETLDKDTIDTTLFPDSFITYEVAIVDPQDDPNPNHAAPVEGDEWEDDDYIYKYGYAWYPETNTGEEGWISQTSLYGNHINYPNKNTEILAGGWGVRVKESKRDAESLRPMKNEIWGEPVETLSYTYLNCNNLKVAPVLSKNTVSMIYSFYQTSFSDSSLIIPDSTKHLVATFEECSSLTSMPIIPEGVITMYRTFLDVDSLTETSPIPSSVKVMQSTFAYSDALVESPDLSNTKNLVSLNGAFSRCTSFNDVPDLTNSPLLEDLSGAFSYCRSLTDGSIYVGPSVIWIEGTFTNCSNLITAPTLLSAINLKEMRGTFNGCSKLINGPKVIPSTVVRVQNCFLSCFSLKEAPDMKNIPALKIFDSAFANCRNLTTAYVNISESAVTTTSMFFGCTKLTTTPNMTNAVNVTSINKMFSGCSSLTEVPDLSNMVKLKDMGEAFNMCGKLSYCPVIPASVTNLNNTFGGCTFTTASPIPENVTNMRRTFYKCPNLSDEITIPASVTNITECLDLTSQPITMKYYDTCTVAKTYANSLPSDSNVTPIVINN